MKNKERFMRYKSYFLIALAGVLIGLFLYFFYFYGLAAEKAELLNLGEGADNIAVLQNGDILDQHVCVHYDFDEIMISVDTYPAEGGLDVIVKTEAGDIEEHYYFANSDLKEMGLNIPFSGRKNHLYTIEILGIGMQEGEGVHFFTTPAYGSYGNLYYNGGEVTNNLCMRVMKDTILGKTTLYFLIMIVLIVILLFAYYLIIEKRCKIESVFLAVGFSLGMIYMLMFPPCTVEDEQTHFATTYQYASVLLGEEPVDINGDVLMRQTDAMSYPQFGTITSYHYWIQLLQGNELFVGKQKLVQVQGLNTVLNGNLVVYFPGILGMVIARALGLGLVPLLFLAKINSLIAYILLSYYGIKRMPFGKGFLALIASLPMALIEAGSLSYDSLTNGISFAFLGCALSTVYINQELKKKDIVMTCLMCFLLGFTKGGLYLLLAGLLLMVFQSIKAIFRKEKIWVWISWICGIGGYFISKMGNARMLGRSGDISSLVTTEKAAENGIEYFSLNQFVQNPFPTVQLLVTNFIDEFYTGLSDMVGQRMSWHGVQVPTILVFMILLALGLMLIYDFEREKVIVLNWNKGWVLLIGAVMILCVEFVMLLDMGMIDGTIRGVQGRYFLPIAPLAAVICAERMCVCEEKKTRCICFAAYGIYVLFLLFVILIILQK